MNDNFLIQDEFYMQKAILLAKQASLAGEIPVGAVIVKDGEVLCGAYNLRETQKMATAHAEVLAIEEACKILDTWRLSDCTLYVTLEPCPMCAGALINSRIRRVVYGLKDPAAGCCGSVLNFNSYPFNHAFSLKGGVCEEECRMLLQDFFVKAREKNPLRYDT